MLDVTRPVGVSTGFSLVDPYTGVPISIYNQPFNFGWEYVWHCHLLGHEENDMTGSPAERAALRLPFNPASPPAAPQ